MIRHHHVGVQFVVAQGAVVEQRVDEELGHASNLEDGATVACCDSDKGHAGPRSASGLPHSAMLLGYCREVNPPMGWLS